ncbi:MAG TPA: mechanosensitive ion channel domain-containing protein [Candidatus Baltobacteraceae bacterium]|nr:mechanosensitive ion channel domain-containing protein [Candidatus Baltobacteraceae bacterium]
MHLYHVTLVGVNHTNAEKAVLTLALIAFVVIARYALHYLVRVVRRFSWAERFRFWSHQAINLLTAAFFIVALISIWVGPNAHLATVGGLIGAGVAFALQKFIIAIAGYVVILRGKTFSIGDRIIIGGVRGEVIALDFFQTTVLEMGQPPSVESETDPAMWVMARQYTGRIVIVTNGVIFDQPVYNYSRDFPFLWEEIHIGVGYDDDYEQAEQILLDVARKHTLPVAQMTEQARRHLEHVYDLNPPSVEPRVFYEMTDNWVDLALRFIVPDRGIREIKDAMFRDILRGFKAAGISVASGTYDVVGFPPVRIEAMPAAPDQTPKKP